MQTKKKLFIAICTQLKKLIINWFFIVLRLVMFSILIKMCCRVDWFHLLLTRDSRVIFKRNCFSANLLWEKMIVTWTYWKQNCILSMNIQLFCWWNVSYVLWGLQTSQKTETFISIYCLWFVSSHIRKLWNVIQIQFKRWRCYHAHANKLVYHRRVRYTPPKRSPIVTVVYTNKC